MLSLETIGYYDDEPGSQHYPRRRWPLLYPDTGTSSPSRRTSARAS